MQKMLWSVPDKEIVVLVEDVSKVYTIDEQGEVQALYNIHLQIPKRTGFALIGGNGSGKSTLLRLIAGILKPTKGRIVTIGRTAALIDPGAGFHPELSGWENLWLFGRLSGLSDEEIRARSAEIIEFSGVQNFIHRPMKYYSNGMYLRLAFSAAVFMPFDILLIDEVLAVGDYQFQQKCIAKLTELKNKQERTFVIVSHQTQLLHQLCEYGIWLDKGVIKKSGDLESVVEEYYSAQISEEQDLSKNSLIKIESIEWDRAPAVYQTGDEAMLNVRLFSLKALGNIRLRINVFDVKENFVTHLDPGFSGNALLSFECKISDVEIHLPAMDFFPGNYFLRISIYGSDGLLCRVMRAAPFQVVNDTWNTMINAHTTIRTGVYVKHSFTVIKKG